MKRIQAKPILDSTFANYYISCDTDYKLEIKNAESGDALILRSSSENISDWNDIVDWQSLKIFGINSTKHYLLLSAVILGRSGLATNHTKWLIVDLESGYFHKEQSLSDSPSFFFVREGKLKFYTFDYSGDFLDKRDYDKIALDVRLNEIKDTVFSIVNTATKVCNCQ